MEHTADVLANWGITAVYWLYYSLVVVWLDRIVSPHFGLHKAKRINTLCRNVGSWAKWIFDVCSPLKVRESRSFWKMRAFFVVSDFGSKMRTFSSNLGSFPRDSICWGSLSFTYSFPLFHSLSLDVFLLILVSHVPSLFLSCFMSLAVPSPRSRPQLPVSFIFLFLSERSRDCETVGEFYFSDQFRKPWLGADDQCWASLQIHKNLNTLHNTSLVHHALFSKSCWLSCSPDADHI